MNVTKATITLIVVIVNTYMNCVIISIAVQNEMKDKQQFILCMNMCIVYVTTTITLWHKNLIQPLLLLG